MGAGQAPGKQLIGFPGHGPCAETGTLALESPLTRWVTTTRCSPQPAHHRQLPPAPTLLTLPLAHPQTPTGEKQTPGGFYSTV